VKLSAFLQVAAICGCVVQTFAQAPTNWQQRNPYPPVEQPGEVTFNDGQWILADQIGATLASADAKIWDRVSGPPNAQKVIYAENQFIAAAGDFQNGAIYTSPDRQTWQLRQNTPGDLTGLAYGNGVFVATGRDSAWMSQDGITWQPVNTNILFWLPDVIFAQGKFVAVGAQRFTSASTKPLVAVSTNGVDWTNANPPGEPILQAVAYGNGTFVANGDGGNFLTSPDAIAWTMHGGVDEPFWLPPIRFSALAFGNGKFAAASEHYIYYSTNGIDSRMLELRWRTGRKILRRFRSLFNRFRQWTFPRGPTRRNHLYRHRPGAMVVAAFGEGLECNHLRQRPICSRGNRLDSLVIPKRK